MNGIEAYRESTIATGDDGGPDLRVRFSRMDGWEISIVSDRARRWLLRSARPSAQDRGMQTTFRTDLAGVNNFILGARAEGLISEYIGPQEIVRL